MALVFPDFSLLHQFIPSAKRPVNEDGEQATDNTPPATTPATAPAAKPGTRELVSGWPPKGKIDLALSNVAGLTLEELLDLGAEGRPRRMNLGDPSLKITPALKEVVAARHGRPGEPERVLLTVGASEANFLLFGALVGDRHGRSGPMVSSGSGPPFSRVIIEDPTYQPLVNLPTGFGARIERWRRVPLKGWQADIDGLAGLLEADDEPALVVMTNLHNPSGVPTSPERMGRIAKLVGDHGGTLLVDEIFRELEPGLPTVAALGDHCLSVSSGSKVYGVSNLRVGWVMGEPELILRLKELKEYVSAVNSAPCELLTLQALQVGDRLVERARAIKAGNLPRVKAFCDRRPELTWYPSAGLIAFIGVDHPLGSLGLANRLRDEFGILISAGEHFGWPGFLRIGYGCPPRELAGRLEALGAALDRIG